jgi:hypothetical protein
MRKRPIAKRFLSVRDLLPMSEHPRMLQFLEKMGPGSPIKGACSACRRVFVAEPKPGERTDDVLLRMRADFDAHDCHEETRQMTARIVRAAKEKL